MVRARLKNVVDNPMSDDAGFERIRQNIWRALRDCYQPKVDPKVLTRDRLGETECAADCLETQLKNGVLKQDKMLNVVNF
ncbi:hypothetical protein chiPu_0034020 [Chiloscyllium punctatum]|uniref:Uncharacterized protein n=1 Tax=Chiloscyllium punctatum TaxID=137246 RepID=A0A401U3Z2_CHIPU|nr:hypothetical protein [Chiloscyllium punctatum]